MKVNSTAAAWQKANEIFPDSDYMHDSEMSSRAGYPVYWSTKEGSNAHINDLCARLEVVFDNGECVNIWIEEDETQTETETATETPAAPQPAADAQSVSFRVEIEHRTARGETVKTVIDRMANIEATASPADLLDWMQALRQAWTKARKAITRGDWVTFQVTRGQWYTAGKTAGHWETRGFDCWEAVPPQDQDESGIYFLPDTRYTAANRDIYTENAATAAAEILRAM